MTWLARCLVNLYDLSHGTVVLKIPFPSTSSHSSLIARTWSKSQWTLHSEHFKAKMGAYGGVRFVLLCTIYIFKLDSNDNFVTASTSSQAGKLDFLLFLTKIEREYDLYCFSYHVISTWSVLIAVSFHNPWLREKYRLQVVRAMIEHCFV